MNIKGLYTLGAVFSPIQHIFIPNCKFQWTLSWFRLFNDFPETYCQTLLWVNREIINKRNILLKCSWFSERVNICCTVLFYIWKASKKKKKKTNVLCQRFSFPLNPRSPLFVTLTSSKYSITCPEIGSKTSFPVLAAEPTHHLFLIPCYSVRGGCQWRCNSGLFYLLCSETWRHWLTTAQCFLMYSSSAAGAKLSDSLCWKDKEAGGNFRVKHISDSIDVTMCTCVVVERAALPREALWCLKGSVCTEPFCYIGHASPM